MHDHDAMSRAQTHTTERSPATCARRGTLFSLTHCDTARAGAKTGPVPMGLATHGSDPWVPGVDLTGFEMGLGIEA